MSKKQSRVWNGWRSAVRVLLTLVLVYVFAVFVVTGFEPLSVGHHSNARTATCLSNMKQLGMALDQYSQDDNGTLPLGANAVGHGWREAIYPYVKASGIYQCPDDSRGYSPQSPDNLPKSYSANSLCFGSSRKPVALANISGTTILLTDTRGYDGEDWNIVSSSFLPDSGRELYTHIPTHFFFEPVHGKLNCLFADGHVKRLAPTATLTPINLWTEDNKLFTGRDLANVRAILRHAEDK